MSPTEPTPDKRSRRPRQEPDMEGPAVERVLHGSGSEPERRTRFSFHQVFDDVLLVAVDPTREGHEQHLQGVDISRHGPIVPCLTPVRVYRVLGHHELGSNIRILRARITWSHRGRLPAWIEYGWSLAGKIPTRK
jgi:hypothetical protein